MPGLIIAVPTKVAGLIEFAAIPQEHRATKGATWQMWIMLSAATLYALSLIAHLGGFSSSHSVIVMSIVLSAVGLVLLTIGGWFGGELVVRYGIGSRDGPQEKGS